MRIVFIVWGSLLFVVYVGLRYWMWKRGITDRDLDAAEKRHLAHRAQRP